MSEIGGGKFASGAMTAAYAMMFNELKHKWTLYDKQTLHRAAVLDQNVGKENIVINVNTAVVITRQRGGKFNIEVFAVSDCAICYSETLTGGFESTLEADGKGATIPILRTKGLLFSPKNCNFSGSLIYRNVELSKFRRVNILIHGGWNYDTGAGSMSVDAPSILGPLFKSDYNHKFLIK